MMGMMWKMYGRKWRMVKMRLLKDVMRCVYVC